MAVSIPPFHWWRTVFFLIPAIGVYTIVLGVVSIGSSLFGGRGDLGHRCARGWSWLILATTGVDVDFHGAEHLTPGASYVFTANHQSIYDIPIVFWSLPHQLRIIAKRSLGRFPVLGWHLQRTGHVLVDRSKPGHEVFRCIAAVIDRGLSLIVFPEGTRSVDGRLGRFKKAILRHCHRRQHSGRAPLDHGKPARHAAWASDDVPGTRAAHGASADCDRGALPRRCRRPGRPGPGDRRDWGRGERARGEARCGGGYLMLALAVASEVADAVRLAGLRLEEVEVGPGDHRLEAALAEAAGRPCQGN